MRLHPGDWLFEIKWDRFRALLYSDRGVVRLVSRAVHDRGCKPREPFDTCWT